MHFSNCRFFSYHFIKKRGMILEITKIDCTDHCRDNTTKFFLVLGKIRNNKKREMKNEKGRY